MMNSLISYENLNYLLEIQLETNPVAKFYYKKYKENEISSFNMTVEKKISDSTFKFNYSLNTIEVVFNQLSDMEKIKKYLMLKKI
jgi:hypothetical protein